MANPSTGGFRPVAHQEGLVLVYDSGRREFLGVSVLAFLRARTDHLDKEVGLKSYAPWSEIFAVLQESVCVQLASSGGSPFEVY